MSRTRLVIIAALAVIVAVGGLLVWRTLSVRHHSTVTLRQAGPIADRYAADAIAHMPGTPALANKNRSSQPCDDPADNAPAGPVDLGDAYDITYQSAHDNGEIFNQLYDYWTSKKYHLITDQHTAPSLRELIAENPTDGFHIGLREGSVGNLLLTISSPCVRP